MIALIKMSNRSDEARHIFEVKLKNKYQFEERLKSQKYLLTVLKALIQKEQKLRYEHKKRDSVDTVVMLTHKGIQQRIDKLLLSNYQIDVKSSQKETHKIS